MLANHLSSSVCGVQWPSNALSPDSYSPRRWCHPRVPVGWWSLSRYTHHDDAPLTCVLVGKREEKLELALGGNMTEESRQTLGH